MIDITSIIDLFRRKARRADGDRDAASRELPARQDPVEHGSAGQRPVESIEALIALDRELSALKDFPVPQAVEERGWAALQHELERHPVRSTADARAGKAVTGAAPKARRDRGGRRVGLRWALGGVVAGVAVAATLLATLLGGTTPVVVDSGDRPSAATSIVTSGADAPAPQPSVTDGSGAAVVDPSAPGTSAPGGAPSTEGAVPEGPTGSTTPGAPTGSSVTTPSATTPGTERPGVEQPGTTASPSPSTTAQQHAAAQIVGSAKAAALYLADLVVTGNTSGARAIVAPGAQRSLQWMIDSLKDPFDYAYAGAATVPGTDNEVRVTFTIKDRVANNQGEIVEIVRSFAVKVKVDDSKAIVIGISAG